MATLRGDSNAVLKDLTMIAENPGAMARPNLHPKICSTKPEDGAYTKIPIPTNVPFPRKFEGERAVQSKEVTVVQTYNQNTHELTLEFDSDLIRNAKAYDYSDIVQEAAISMELFPDYLLSQSIINGGSNLAYDAVAFYGTTHKYAKAGSNTINNTQSASGQTTAALANDLTDALTKIKTFKDNAGKLLNQMVKGGADQLVIHCPAALEKRFREVVFGSMIPVTIPVTTSGGAAVPVNNQLQGIADVVGDGYLDTDSATKWYLHYIGMPQKPFVFLENYGTQVSVLGLGSEHEVKTNKVMIALKRRFVLGYYRFDRSVKVA